MVRGSANDRPISYEYLSGGPEPTNGEIIQLSFTIFLNKTIFYSLVQHVSLPANNVCFHDVFVKSNERIFSFGNCKVNEKKKKSAEVFNT